MTSLPTNEGDESGPAVGPRHREGQSGPVQDARPTILFLLPWTPDAVGGVPQVVINLHRTFEEHGKLKPCVLVNTYPSFEMRRAETRSLGPIELFYLPSLADAEGGLRKLIVALWRVPVSVVRLRRYLERHDVRAIAIHYPSLSCCVVLLARHMIRPHPRIALCFHGQDVETIRASRTYHRWLWRRAIGGCDAVVTCSQSLAEEFGELFHAHRAKVRAIHNGIDAAACRARAGVTAAPAELRGKEYIACVANFEPKKGHDVLIHAFAEIARSRTGLHLALVGGYGPLQGALQRLASDLGVGERVLFFNDLPHDETLAVIAGARVMVLSSRREPFGIVLLEAAALGIPTVACRVGGIPEVVEDGRTGLLVPPDDAAMLARRIEEVLGDPALAARLAGAFRREAEHRFTWRAAAERYAEVLGVAAGDGARCKTGGERA